jgi:hypothetical protein
VRKSLLEKPTFRLDKRKLVYFNLSSLVWFAKRRIYLHCFWSREKEKVAPAPQPVSPINLNIHLEISSSLAQKLNPLFYRMIDHGFYTLYTRGSAVGQKVLNIFMHHILFAGEKDA